MAVRVDAAADAGPARAAPTRAPANTAGISCFPFMLLASFVSLLLISHSNNIPETWGKVYGKGHFQMEKIGGAN